MPGEDERVVYVVGGDEARAGDTLEGPLTGPDCDLVGRREKFEADRVFVLDVVGVDIG